MVPSPSTSNLETRRLSSSSEAARPYVYRTALNSSALMLPLWSLSKERNACCTLLYLVLIFSISIFSTSSAVALTVVSRACAWPWPCVALCSMVPSMPPPAPSPGFSSSLTNALNSSYDTSPLASSSKVATMASRSSSERSTPNDLSARRNSACEMVPEWSSSKRRKALRTWLKLLASLFFRIFCALSRFVFVASPMSACFLRFSGLPMTSSMLLPIESPWMSLPNCSLNSSYSMAPSLSRSMLFRMPCTSFEFTSRPISLSTSASSSGEMVPLWSLSIARKALRTCANLL
mmetsp:Transcript_11855/g.41576  ORF Transcript_11855/g.41576 Transcript_11855/m.41576 type:complete len:291 (+) Transcript_11855:140-1012(+)